MQILNGCFIPLEKQDISPTCRRHCKLSWDPLLGHFEGMLAH